MGWSPASPHRPLGTAPAGRKFLAVLGAKNTDFTGKNCSRSVIRARAFAKTTVNAPCNLLFCSTLLCVGLLQPLLTPPCGLLLLPPLPPLLPRCQQHSFHTISSHDGHAAARSSVLMRTYHVLAAFAPFSLRLLCALAHCSAAQRRLTLTGVNQFSSIHTSFPSPLEWGRAI